MEIKRADSEAPIMQKAPRRPTEELVEMDEGYVSMPTIKDGVVVEQAEAPMELRELSMDDRVANIDTDSIDEEQDYEPAPLSKWNHQKGSFDSLRDARWGNRTLAVNKHNVTHLILPEEDEEDDNSNVSFIEESMDQEMTSNLRKWAPVSNLQEASLPSDDMDTDLDLSSWEAKKLAIGESSYSLKAPFVPLPAVLEKGTESLSILPGISQQQRATLFKKSPAKNSATSNHSSNDSNQTLQKDTSKLRSWLHLPPILKRFYQDKKDKLGESSNEPLKRKEKNRSITGEKEQKKSPLIHRLIHRKITTPTRVSPQPRKVLAPKIVDPPDIALKDVNANQSADLDAEDDLLLDYHSRKEKLRFEASYEVLKQLGSGGHSTVRLAKRKSDGTLVACKFIHASSVWHWCEDDTLSKPHPIPLEIFMMKSFKEDGNPSMIEYQEHFEIGPRFVIVMEYLGEEWMDLYDYIEFFGPVAEGDTREIFHQVVQVLNYMHRQGFCHNDIKDENIMIHTKTRRIKLIDFGSTTALRLGVLTDIFYGTKKFAAPEAISSNRQYYQECQEVWALGTLLYVLLFKMDPFKSDEEVLELDIEKRINRLRNASYGKTFPTFVISREAVDALVLMMHKDWRKRPTLTQIMNLKFLQG